MLGRVELGLHVFAGTARAVEAAVVLLAVRVTALDHESRNDAMEFGVVVEPCAREVEEVLDVVGGDLGEEFDGDVAVTGSEDGLCHGGER